MILLPIMIFMLQIAIIVAAIDYVQFDIMIQEYNTRFTNSMVE